MPGLNQKHYKSVYEDWMRGENIATSVADGVAWLTTADSGGTAGIIVADADGPVAEVALDTTDNDMGELAYHLVTFSAQNGRLEGEWRVKLSAGTVALAAINVGFNDDALEDSNTLPVELATTTFTSNAATFIGVVFDGDATNDDFHCFWVDDDTDTSEVIADLRMVGLAPVADEWFGVRIVLNDRGSGKGVRAEFTVCEESTGKMIQKVFNTNVDRDVLLTPGVWLENRGTEAHSFQCDYIEVNQSRANT